MHIWQPQRYTVYGLWLQNCPCYTWGMTNEQRLLELLEVFEDTLTNFAEGRHTLDFHAATVRQLLQDTRALIGVQPEQPASTMQA